MQNDDDTSGHKSWVARVTSGVNHTVDWIIDKDAKLAGALGGPIKGPAIEQSSRQASEYWRHGHFIKAMQQDAKTFDMTIGGSAYVNPVESVITHHNLDQTPPPPPKRSR